MNELNRKSCLEKAMKCVLGDRENEYGSPEDNFETIAEMWTAYMHWEVEFTQVDVAMMMALLKVARVATGTATDDSFVDIAGYAACAAELKGNAQKNEESWVKDIAEDDDIKKKASDLGKSLAYAMKNLWEEKLNNGD